MVGGDGDGDLRLWGGNICDGKPCSGAKRSAKQQKPDSEPDVTHFGSP